MLENLPEEHAAELSRRGIVPLHGIAEAIDAAEAAAFIGEAWATSPLSAPACRWTRHRTRGRRGRRFSRQLKLSRTP